MFTIDKPMERDARWEIKRSFRRAAPSLAREYGAKHSSYAITATASLHKIQGNESPHFSVTGEILNLRKRGDNQIESCGSIHVEILRFFPKLVPVVAVHLSDHHGVPMHGVANAVYWAGFSTWGKMRDGAPMAPDDDYGRRLLETADDGLVWAPKVFADQLRVSVAEGRKMRAEVVGSPVDDYAAAMRIVIDRLRPRWQEEADAAYAVITAPHANEVSA